MTITINGSDIEFTLEKEQTAGDVLNGVASWLEESGMLVGGIRLDGETVALADETWRERSVDGIDEFAVEVVSHREGRLRQLETTRDFFVLLHNAAVENDSSSLEELSEGFSDLRRILPHLLSEGAESPMLGHLEAALNAAGFPVSSGVPTDLETVRTESERMGRLMESRRREIAAPEGEAMGAATALAAMSDSLDDVAVHLQTGKDKLAMETIILLTELLQTLMRSLSWIPDTGGAPEIVDDLNGILVELEDALKASDTVLIGDLLEYEIKPRLQELPGRLNFTGEAAS